MTPGRPVGPAVRHWLAGTCEVSAHAAMLAARSGEGPATARRVSRGLSPHWRALCPSSPVAGEVSTSCGAAGGGDISRGSIYYPHRCLTSCRAAPRLAVVNASVVRVFSLLLADSLGVHELRYRLAFGADAGNSSRMRVTAT